MAIYDILNQVQDAREGNAGICEFNGFLEDYLSTIEAVEGKEETHALLTKLFEKDSNLRICVRLRLNINKDAIANQIIRYKDAFKLPKGTIVCPYIVYGKFDDVQKAIILTLGDKEEYVKAKALYYVMSEPENEYEGTRNEIIADCLNEEHLDLMLGAVDKFFFQNSKAGIVQRELDAKMFDSYTQMYELANEMGKKQEAELRDLLKESDDKEACINQIIANWFLLKKFSYVQYMMDKNNLNKVHEGNVKRQRQVAKEKSDAIGFVSYSELWKLAKELS
ncbi:hypothetical protein [[Eubacterium] hominis]|uniref:hypothetical protein n=1 Tax=[Eubacterium] hominis TaxID=2764325 RepID=UPI003A4E4AB8